MPRFGNPFRSKREGSIDSSLSGDTLQDVRRQSENPVNPFGKLRKAPRSKSLAVDESRPVIPRPDGKFQKKPEAFPAIDVSQTYARDKQTGEVLDHTDLLHSLAKKDSNESLLEKARLLALTEPTEPGERIVAKLSRDLWLRVLEDASPSDAASLAHSCKAFRDLLGFEPWQALNHPDNHRHKIDFLLHMDKHLPRHLFCFECATYHLRTQHGKESLKPANVINPLFECPLVSSPTKKLLRTRLTYGRTLPFSFVQLAIRAHDHSPDHGIDFNTLSRRYKDQQLSWYGSWSHQTKYAIFHDHLLVRVTSQIFAPAGLPPSGLRHLLYSREDFIPYFSVCSHWRDGELMPSVKCALSHIPKPLEGSGIIRVKDNVKQRLHPPAPIITLCQECKPMRRCPFCPTEYLIELKMAEDRTDSVNLFKQALVVTRWSDLGDGSSPWSPEWAAVNGEGDYDSFGLLGKRAVSGIFEGEWNGETIPGQRMISLNPNKETLGEAGHNWY